MHDSKMEQCLDEELEEVWYEGWREIWLKKYFVVALESLVKESKEPIPNRDEGLQNE